MFYPKKWIVIQSSLKIRVKGDKISSTEKEELMIKDNYVLKNIREY